MKNSSDTIGNRTRDLPACSAVPQSTAPPRAPFTKYALKHMAVFFKNCALLSGFHEFLVFLLKIKLILRYWFIALSIYAVTDVSEEIADVNETLF